MALHLGDLARELQQESTLQDTLDGIVRAAVDNVPGAWMAGISSVEGRRKISTTAGSHPLAFEVDRLQYRVGEGPCLSAIYDQRTLRLPDMTAETRWPTFTEQAWKLGIGSMLSFQLYVENEDLGALNLYHPEPGGFDDESEHVGLLFATHAAVAMAGSLARHQLSLAVATRDLIGQAKGILMERHRLTGDQAFELLVRASQRGNMKLRDVAEQLTSSGELPGREQAS
ncbi:MAG: GAF and ANTAR domain-containing protein [Pseudonocardia sp.]|nr:GAF and ANTAR domain-containing protein [Pseudonocardia sp.]